jgi:peptidoglycan hydrolase-like protein with peptidoglycan-binding domain
MEGRMKGLVLATVSAIALGLGGAATAHAWSYSGGTTGAQGPTYYPNYSSSSSYTVAPRYTATPGYSGYAGIAYRPRRSLIARAQLALRRDGLYRGAIDGILGPGTSAALEAFQQQHGLRVTGNLNPGTMANLFGAAPVPRRYAGLYRTHGQIAQAQLALRRDGLYHGNIDGIIGPETRQALADFQRQRGLPVTYTLSPRTMASLGIGSVYQGSGAPGAAPPPGAGGMTPPNTRTQAPSYTGR